MSLSGGTITFTPATGHVGAASFTYVLSDGAGGTDTATVSLSTTPNQAPTANNDGYTTDEDQSVAGNLRGNDTDPEGDSLTATLVSDVSHGTLVLHANGNFSYTPDTDFNGADAFTYEISDGHGGTDTAVVSITVDPVNDDPVAVNDNGFATANTVPLHIAAATLLANDSDGDPELNQGLTIISVGGAVNGSVSLSGGTITFTPATGHVGAASFTYVLSDGAGGTDTAAVSLNTGPNQAPTANNDGFAVDEDSTVAGNVLENDTDPEDDSLTAALVSAPLQGVLTFAANGSFSYSADADLFDLATPGEVIEQTFTYEVTDAHGGTDLATVTLFVAILDDGETFVAADRHPDRVTGTDGGEDLILGGAGNDRLDGLDGADTLLGGQGKDRLHGGLSADALSGEGGDDDLYGDDGDDDLDGGGGNDRLTGGKGNDRMNGGSGNDTLKGGTGDDGLKGKHGRDLLKGGNGDDVLKGGADDDTIKGGKDADRLLGGNGDDFLKGGNGDDWLLGGNGHDRMRGGGGADTFVFELGRGADKVLDFADGEDMLALKGLAYDDLGIAQTGDDSTISVDGTVIAVLLDVNAAFITESDFIV